MSSIGELFIQLGVLGNANELKKANQEFQKANILAEKQAKLEKLRAEYLEKINKAQDKAEKREIAKQYKAKKALIEQQTALKLKGQEQKILQGNIAQWATYAHVVTQAASMAVSAIKKINSEVDKTLRTNQQFYNFSKMTSSSLSNIQGYSTIASIFNPALSKEQAASKMVEMDNKFFAARRTGDFSNIADVQRLMQFSSKKREANRFVNDLYGRRITDFKTYIERARSLIEGVSPEEQTSLVQALFGDDSLLPMLRKSNTEIEAILKKANKYKLSQTEVERLEAARIEIETIKSNLSDIYNRFIIKFVPYIEQGYKYLFALAQEIMPQIRKAVNDIKTNFNDIDAETFKSALEGALTVMKAIVDLIAKAVKGWILIFDQINKIKKLVDAKNEQQTNEGKINELNGIKNNDAVLIAKGLRQQQKGNTLNNILETLFPLLRFSNNSKAYQHALDSQGKKFLTFSDFYNHNKQQLLIVLNLKLAYQELNVQF